MGGNRLSDADFAVYLRNIALALAKEARERNIKIEITADSADNYVNARFGDYCYTKCNEVDEYFRFAPYKGPYEDTEWHRVKPDQIRTGGLPEGGKRI